MALLRGRFGLYALISTIATYAVVRYAYTTREQFYPAVIYMVSSKTSIVVLCNMALVLIVTAAAALKALFLGELRTAEVERVNEALRFTIPEICVALTLFREELTMRVLGLFAMLLFSRFFHTVLDERMNFVSDDKHARHCAGTSSHSGHLLSAPTRLRLTRLRAPHAPCRTPYHLLLIYSWRATTTRAAWAASATCASSR